MNVVAPAKATLAAPDDGARPITNVHPPAAESPGVAVRARRLGHMSLALGILAVIAVVAALYFARAFLVPLLIGIITSYSLRPVVDWLRWLHIPRPIAAALVLAVLVGGVSWIGYSMGDEATVMIEKLPDATRKLRQNLSSARSAAPTALQNVQEAASELQRVATDVAEKPGARAVARPAPAPTPDSTPWLRDYALAQSALLMSVVAETPIVLLLAYFLLASGSTSDGG